MAVIVTSVPSSKVPPSVETVPPSPAETVSVYCVGGGGSGSGVWIIVGGGVVSSSSAEQLYRIRNAVRVNAIDRIVFSC